MAETLRSRVANIIVGNAHALLNRIEDLSPEARMEQAIRQVDEVIEEVRTELGKTAANRHLAQKQHAELNRRHLELSTQAEEAVALQRDDLARAALSRQLDIETQIPVVEAALTELTVVEREQKGYVDALLAKKRDMEEALSQYIASRAAASAPAGLSAATSRSQHKADKAGEAFDRLFQRQTGLTRQGMNGTAQETAQLKEIDDLVNRKKIEDRLASLKAGS